MYDKFTYIFYERTTDSEGIWVRYTYMFWEDGVIAMRVQLAKNQLIFYTSSILPSELITQGEKWFNAKSEASPPFEPGTAYPIRYKVPVAGNGKTQVAYFLDQSGELKEWLAGLRDEVVKPKNQIEQLPKWLTNDESLNKYFQIGR